MRQFLQDIIHTFYQLSPLLYQAIGSPAGTGGNISWNGKDLSPLFKGKLGGDQGSAVFHRLNYQHTSRQAADNPVSPWKVLRKRLCRHGEFGNKCPFFDHFLKQFPVFRWIQDINTAAKNTDAPASPLECAIMGSGIHSPGHAGYN